jgi:hypothetical protein
VPHSSRRYRDGWGCGLLAQLACPFGLDLDAPCFDCTLVTEAAEPPVFWLIDSAALDWIAMHVAQCLHVIRLGEDAEALVTSLPELWSVAFELF